MAQSADYILLRIYFRGYEGAKFIEIGYGLAKILTTVHCHVFLAHSVLKPRHVYRICGRNGLDASGRVFMGRADLISSRTAVQHYT